MKTADKIHNSAKTGGFENFPLANGYISTTTIFFEAESILAVIEAKGHIAFFDPQEHLLAAFDLPEEEYGKRVYEEVQCGVENGAIVLKFPIVEWIENYPNCDGEHDRWDTKLLGWQTASLDLTNHAVRLN